jgi:PTS system N-acetylglucosamine-specific IIC component
VVGPAADQLAGQIRAALRAAGAAPGTADGPPAAPAAAPVAGEAPWPGAPALLAALGGSANVRAVEQAASRLRLTVTDCARIDAGALRALGARGIATPAPDCVHVILGPDAGSAARSLRALLPA